MIKKCIFTAMFIVLIYASNVFALDQGTFEFLKSYRQNEVVVGFVHYEPQKAILIDVKNDRLCLIEVRRKYSAGLQDGQYYIHYSKLIFPRL